MGVRCVSELCLIRVILPVTDVEAAASFYAHLLDMPGSRVIRRADITSTGGGTILACYDALADGDPEHVGSILRTSPSAWTTWMPPTSAHAMGAAET